MVLPETPTTSWLPTVGVTLVGLPWLFWLFTFLYRVLSRVFGFRLGMDCGGDQGGESNVEPDAVATDDHDESPTAGNNGERKVQFEAAVTVHENSGGDDRDRDRGGDRHDQDRYKHSNVSSSSNSSIMSHESEMPLASSMAS
ncbi:hypothetical protein TIFTF001_003986 [Ficus carica]|uniref:Uncharacterized protein n=1 Tax=Ficus carica TaxID=3494 RepID=A0AA87ZA40_FICCA|nr:hypothetical protein TIFTF001_003986 [Ficus carica]